MIAGCWAPFDKLKLRMHAGQLFLQNQSGIVSFECISSDAFAQPLSFVLRRGAKMRFLFALAALAMVVVSFAAPAYAESLDDLARGLRAQFQASLIRERKLADDREQAVLREAEARVLQARIEADAYGDAKELELSEARAEYASIAGTLIARDREASDLSDAYSLQLTRDLEQSSPKQREALQRFADGDLRAGFDQYRSESQRRSAARLAVLGKAAAAADAATLAETRQQATMADTLRSSGKATLGEVLSLWESVVQISPTDSYANQRLSGLLIDSYELDRASQFAQASLEHAKSDAERIGSLVMLRRIATNRNDLQSAKKFSDASLKLAKEMHQRDPQSVYLAHFLIESAIAHDDLNLTLQAQELFREAKVIAESRLPNSTYELIEQYQIVSAVAGLAGIQQKAGNYSGALQTLTESQANISKLMAPNRRADDYSLFLEVNILAGILLQQAGDHSASRDTLRQVVDLAKLAINVDPSSNDFARRYSSALTSLGDAERNLGNSSLAAELYRESLAIDHRLYEVEPNRLSSVTDYWISLWRVARYADGNWKDVIKTMEDAKRKGLLPEHYEQHLKNARKLMKAQR